MADVAETHRALEERIGYEFADRELLTEAVTHRSFANERGLAANYERLEFLGDAVLGLLAAEFLFDRFPAAPEGELSQLLGYLVSEPVLARQAHDLEVGAALRLGVGEERSGGRDKSSLLADVLESILGAIYVDGGLEPVRDLVLPLFEEATRGRASEELRDAKTRLQEIVQGRGWALPEYRQVADGGPDHHKWFHIECWVRGKKTGEGVGSTKKLAQQRAAGAALEALEASWGAGPSAAGGDRDRSDTLTEGETP